MRVPLLNGLGIYEVGVKVFTFVLKSNFLYKYNFCSFNGEDTLSY